jgi:hypothetical protein
MLNPLIRREIYEKNDHGYRPKTTYKYIQNPMIICRLNNFTSYLSEHQMMLNYQTEKSDLGNVDGDEEKKASCDILDKRINERRKGLNNKIKEIRENSFKTKKKLIQPLEKFLAQQNIGSLYYSTQAILNLFTLGKSHFPNLNKALDKLELMRFGIFPSKNFMLKPLSSGILKAWFEEMRMMYGIFVDEKTQLVFHLVVYLNIKQTTDLDLEPQLTISLVGVNNTAKDIFKSFCERSSISSYYKSNFTTGS